MEYEKITNCIMCSLCKEFSRIKVCENCQHPKSVNNLNVEMEDDNSSFDDILCKYAIENIVDSICEEDIVTLTAEVILQLFKQQISQKSDHPDVLEKLQSHAVNNQPMKKAETLFQSPSKSIKSISDRQAENLRIAKEKFQQRQVAKVEDENDATIASTISAPKRSSSVSAASKGRSLSTSQSAAVKKASRGNQIDGNNQATIGDNLNNGNNEAERSQGKEKSPPNASLASPAAQPASVSQGTSKSGGGGGSISSSTGRSVNSKSASVHSTTNTVTFTDLSRNTRTFVKVKSVEEAVPPLSQKVRSAGTSPSPAKTKARSVQVVSTTLTPYSAPPSPPLSTSPRPGQRQAAVSSRTSRDNAMDHIARPVANGSSTQQSIKNSSLGGPGHVGGGGPRRFASPSPIPSSSSGVGDGLRQKRADAVATASQRGVLKDDPSADKGGGTLPPPAPSHPAASDNSASHKGVVETGPSVSYIKKADTSPTRDKFVMHLKVPLPSSPHGSPMSASSRTPEHARAEDKDDLGTDISVLTCDLNNRSPARVYGACKSGDESPSKLRDITMSHIYGSRSKHEPISSDIAQIDATWKWNNGITTAEKNSSKFAHVPSRLFEVTKCNVHGRRGKFVSSVDEKDIKRQSLSRSSSPITSVTSGGGSVSSSPSTSSKPSPGARLGDARAGQSVSSSTSKRSASTEKSRQSSSGRQQTERDGKPAATPTLRSTSASKAIRSQPGDPTRSGTPCRRPVSGTVRVKDKEKDRDKDRERDIEKDIPTVGTGSGGQLTLQALQSNNVSRGHDLSATSTSVVGFGGDSLGAELQPLNTETAETDLWIAPVFDQCTGIGI